MLIGEPPRSQADLHFSILGIPVRVHPLFWFVSLLLGIRGDSLEPVPALLWVVAVFVSILIHELGHALTARAHGWQPWITLYGMGGLASYQPTYHTTRSSLLVAAAGPAAGLAFAALTLVAILLSGHAIWWAPQIVPLQFESFHSNRLNLLISDLLQINILWSLINLFPIYPLDGGNIARELFLFHHRASGIARSLWLSTATGALLAIYALSGQQFFLAMLFGYLAYSSYQTLQVYQGQRW